MTNAETLTADLRRCLEGADNHRLAAAELLINHDYWLRTNRFRDAAVRVVEDGAYISWTSVREAFDAGVFDRASTSERAVLDLAIALGEDRYHLGNMGTVHREWIVQAVTTAVGAVKPSLPSWEEMSDLDKGCALVYLREIDYEGALATRANYPCKYRDAPALAILTPGEACDHADGLVAAVGDFDDFVDAVGDGEYERLYNLVDAPNSSAVIAQPNACRWCGIAERSHRQQYLPGPGWHAWTAPTDAQRLERMKARRTARGGA